MRCHKNFQHFILFFAGLKKGRGNFGVVYRAFFIEQRIKRLKIKDYYIFNFSLRQETEICNINVSLILTSLKLEKS